MFKYPRLLAVVVPAVALFCATAARATTLLSPPAIIGHDRYLYCMVANASTSPIQVQISVINETGTDVALGSDCPPPGLAPGAICYRMAAGLNAASAYCRITTSSSKVRASLIVRATTGEIITVLPATR